MRYEEKKLMQVINHIETTFPVNKWRINGVDVWPLIRIELGFKAITVTRPQNNVEVKDNFSSKLSEASLLLENDETVDAFIFFDSFTRTKLNDCWYSRLTGLFNEEIRKMGMRAVNLEYNYNRIEKVPVCDESYSIINQLNYVQNMLLADNITHLEQYKDVKELWLSKLGKNIDFPSIENINNSAAYIHKLSLLFETLLVQKKTKAVFIIPFYNRDSYALILAARRIGIPSIDIQHGNQSSPFYYNWLNIPVGGYNILPSYFWCWSQKEKAYFEDWTSDLKVHQAIAGGNPWIELWKDTSHPIVEQYDLEIDLHIDSNKINILVTLQPLYGLNGWDQNIPTWLMEVIDTSPDNWKWYIRYHHSMLDTYSQEIELCEALLEPYILSGKVETQYATSMPLMAILRKMSVHITAFSTCVIEAMALQVPSVTLHEKGHLYFKNEYLSGLVSHARNSKELLQEINFYILKKKENLLPSVQTDYVGLSNGLYYIFNNQLVNSCNYNDKCTQTLIQKEFYFADGNFEKVIELYKRQPIARDTFIVGRAYEQLNRMQQADSCYQEFVNYLVENQNGLDSYLNELLLMKKFYRKYNNINHHLETIDSYIYKVIYRNKDLANTLFKTLFHNKEYEEIKFWKDKVGKTIDVCFFAGRALLKLEEIEEGILLLEEYLEFNTRNETSVKGLTSQLNYKISAEFYLGENYLRMDNESKALKHLNSCLHLSKGQHIKAKELLDILSSEKLE